jgi:hypothetical protein
MRFAQAVISSTLTSSQRRGTCRLPNNAAGQLNDIRRLQSLVFKNEAVVEERAHIGRSGKAVHFLSSPESVWTAFGPFDPKRSDR